MTKEIDTDNKDLFDGWGNGSLHLYIICTSGKKYIDKDDTYLGLDFHYDDWRTLLCDALKANTDYDEYVQGEDIGELYERNQKRFQQSIPEYPMLARIYDMYKDYNYTSQEIVELRSECLKLKSELTESNAIRALRKLIYACDEALKAECDLRFVCD